MTSSDFCYLRAKREKKTGNNIEQQPATFSRNITDYKKER